jgi:hypothetical protein
VKDGKIYKEKKLQCFMCVEVLSNTKETNVAMLYGY